MKTGDIILIPFPFSELTQVKVRPAVLITETMDSYKDLVLAAISSQVPFTVGETELLVQPTVSNGLRVPSIIKVDRIFTLKRNKVIHHLGQLSPGEQASFKAIFQSLVD